MEIIDKMIDSGFHGISFGFNDGAVVTAPKSLDAEIKITDVDTCTVLCYINIQDTLKNVKVDDLKDILTITTDKKYYINYLIEVWCGDEYWSHKMDLTGQPVRIYLGENVIGDNIAWLPYVEEFQRKHNCIVYCSLYNKVVDIVDYPNINFISNDDNVESYATYCVGFFISRKDSRFQPIDARYVGIQKAAAYQLGLEPEELKCNLKPAGERTISEKYVCISVQATTACKCWNNPEGWIAVVQYLKDLGYRVLCIDKEPVSSRGRLGTQIPYGCEDFTGDIPLMERVNLLTYADFFVGCSSGLAWIAYAVGIPVVMISGFTLPLNEFYTPYRVINYNGCNGCFNYEEFDPQDYGYCPLHKGTEKEFECSRAISPAYVIKYIDKLMQDKHFLE